MDIIYKSKKYVTIVVCVCVCCERAPYISNKYQNDLQQIEIEIL